jgi:hypothetical protein
MGRRFMPHVKQLAMKTRGNQASCLSMKTTAGWDERHPLLGLMWHAACLMLYFL